MHATGGINYVRNRTLMQLCFILDMEPEIQLYSSWISWANTAPTQYHRTISFHKLTSVVVNGTSILYLSRLEQLQAKSKLILAFVFLLFWNTCVILERLVKEPKTCWQWARVFKAKQVLIPASPAAVFSGVVFFYLLD